MRAARTASTIRKSPSPLKSDFRTRRHHRAALVREQREREDRAAAEQAARDEHVAAHLAKEVEKTLQLADTAARLAIAEDQLRSLQANLIAECMKTSEHERKASDASEKRERYKTELATAVSALRRARDDGKKSEEERRRLLRAFEETRVR